ncbi:hypothetical protein D623_10020914 [Myotis brandtii]|uniref:Uncharacterized protein n=1 Tax=Myotis brandtii TaxID=109478 RepID=S7PKA0_MYOBR|nr:hypothetical protein D623_10020914 [Myotis brandtii]
MAEAREGIGLRARRLCHLDTLRRDVPSAKRCRSLETCVPPGSGSTGPVPGKRSGSPSRGSVGMGDITLGA